MDTAWTWDLSSYCAKYSFLTEPRGVTMREVERIFQLDPEPPVHENLNDYIIKAVRSRELRWFSFFLHCYENRLNGRVRRFLLREGLDRYDPERFLDYKMGCVLAMLDCLREYDPAQGADFLTYAHHFIGNALLTCRMQEEAGSFENVDEYKAVRGIAWLYNQSGQSEQTAIQKYARKNGCTEETAAKFLTLAKQNRSRVPFYQTMQDEDSEETGEDVSRDDHWDYAEILWNGIQAEAVREAFEKLNYREQTLLEKRNAICMTCGRVSPISTRLTFEELAILFEGSTASGAERAYRKAVEHLEHLTKPKSDQSGSKGEKSQMDISPAFISDEQAPVSMEPGKGSLNNPAVLSKMSGTVHPASGNAVLYMSHGARLSAKRKIVPFGSLPNFV